MLYHAPQRRILQDVVTCIREGCTIDDAGFRRERHADRHLKPPEEMARLFASYLEAVVGSAEIAARCAFSLAELSYRRKRRDSHSLDVTALSLVRHVPWRIVVNPSPLAIRFVRVGGLAFLLGAIRRVFSVLSNSYLIFGAFEVTGESCQKFHQLSAGLSRRCH